MIELVNITISFNTYYRDRLEWNVSIISKQSVPYNKKLKGTIYVYYHDTTVFMNILVQFMSKTMSITE